MSSRLLNMKFMQRAAASASQSTPASPSTPGDDRPSKRARTSLASSVASPDAEEIKRAAALERVGREKGETRWVLSTPGPAPATPKTVSISLGELDASTPMVGRKRYGAAPAASTPARQDEEDDKDSASGSEDEGDDVDALIARERGKALREERKGKRRAMEQEGRDMAKRRREKGVKLNSPAGGISSGGRRSLG